MESVTGFKDPAAKGARVKGMRPAETILFNVNNALDEEWSPKMMFQFEFYWVYPSSALYVGPTHLSKLQW